MPTPINASMPQELELGGGYTIRVTAVDPSTGAAISGVTVSNLVLMVDDLTGGSGSGLAFGPYQLVPGPGT